MRDAVAGEIADSIDRTLYHVAGKAPNVIRPSPSAVELGDDAHARPPARRSRPPPGSGAGPRSSWHVRARRSRAARCVDHGGVSRPGQRRCVDPVVEEEERVPGVAAVGAAGAWAATSAGVREPVRRLLDEVELGMQPRHASRCVFSAIATTRWSLSTISRRVGRRRGPRRPAPDVARRARSASNARAMSRGRTWSSMLIRSTSRGMRGEEVANARGAHRSRGSPRTRTPCGRDRRRGRSDRPGAARDLGRRARSGLRARSRIP